MQLLLDSGVNANLEMAMSSAAAGGHASVVQALMAAGAVPLWLHLWPHADAAVSCTHQVHPF